MHLINETEILDKNLIKVLGSDNKLIDEVNRYIVDSGGKRVRPLITTLVGEHFKLNMQDFLDFASAVELVHTASLMHDDVVDFGEQRRGINTVFNEWGANVSVLMGDFIVSRAYNLIALRNRLDLLREFVLGVEMMAEGELIQISHKNSTVMRENQYYEVIDRKTSALFRLAFIIVPTFLNLENDINILSDAGIAVGRTFQIIDDIIDYTSPGEILGKDRYKDFYERKPTLPLVIFFKKGYGNMVKEIWDKKEFHEEEIGNIKDKMVKEGVFDESREIAQKHSEKAITILRNYDSEAMNKLIMLITTLIQRIK